MLASPASLLRCHLLLGIHWVGSKAKTLARTRLLPTPFVVCTFVVRRVMCSTITSEIGFPVVHLWSPLNGTEGFRRCLYGHVYQQPTISLASVQVMQQLDEEGCVRVVGVLKILPQRTVLVVAQVRKSIPSLTLLYVASFLSQATVDYLVASRSYACTSMSRQACQAARNIYGRRPRSLAFASFSGVR